MLGIRNYFKLVLTSEDIFILVHASSFSAKDTTEGLPLNIKHLEKFCFYMFELVGIEIAKVTHNNTVYELKLPDELKEELGFHSKNIRISFIKDAKLIRKGILLMDINNPLLRMLFEKAKSPGFGGQLAIIKGMDSKMPPFVKAFFHKF